MTAKLPPIDPSEPLTPMEKLVFGENAVRDPVTGIPFEQGSGAHPPDIQSRLYSHNVNLPKVETPATQQQPAPKPAQLQ